MHVQTDSRGTPTSRRMAVAPRAPVNDAGGTLMLWVSLFIVGPRMRRAATTKRRCLGRSTTRRLERCAAGVLARAQRQQQWCVVAEGCLAHAMWRYQTAQEAATDLPGSLSLGESAILYACYVAASVVCHVHDTLPETAPPAATSPQPCSSERRCRSRPPNLGRGAE